MIQSLIRESLWEQDADNSFKWGTTLFSQILKLRSSLFLYWLTKEIIYIKTYPHCVFLLNQYNSQSTQKHHQDVLSTYYLHSHKEFPSWCEELCVNLINSLLESSICFKFCILTVNVYNSNQSFFYINWNLLYRNTMVWIE